MRRDRDTPAATPAGRREQLDRELADATRAGRTVTHWKEAGRTSSYAASDRAAANHQLTAPDRTRHRQTAPERAAAQLIDVHRHEYDVLLARQLAQT